MFDALEAFAAVGRPKTFRIGSAEFLAEVSVLDGVPEFELTVVDYGGAFLSSSGGFMRAIAKTRSGCIGQVLLLA